MGDFGSVGAAGAAVAIGIILLVWFLERPSKRDKQEQEEREPTEPDRYYIDRDEGTENFYVRRCSDDEMFYYGGFVACRDWIREREGD